MGYIRRRPRRAPRRRARRRSKRWDKLAGQTIAFVLGLVFLFVIVPLIEKAIMAP